ncbi:hypothetical protein ACFVZ3_08175 [Kitasatospora purpeofusca]|uniref:hypothetical protein n=1 Tax=Kitasatospora purpeofusca TaxID=67352 RepID=UPI00367472D3
MTRTIGEAEQQPVRPGTAQSAASPRTITAQVAALRFDADNLVGGARQFARQVAAARPLKDDQVDKLSWLLVYAGYGSNRLGACLKAGDIQGAEHFRGILRQAVETGGVDLTELRGEASSEARCASLDALVNRVRALLEGALVVGGERAEDVTGLLVHAGDLLGRVATAEHLVGEALEREVHSLRRAVERVEQGAGHKEGGSSSR